MDILCAHLLQRTTRLNRLNPESGTALSLCAQMRSVVLLLGTPLLSAHCVLLSQEIGCSRIYVPIPQRRDTE
jgi:hypothetical protein